MHICIGRSGSKNQGLLQLRGSEKISGIMEAGVESVGVVDESLVAGTNESNRNGEGLCYLFVYGKSYKFENKIVVNKFFIHRNWRVYWWKREWKRVNYCRKWKRRRETQVECLIWRGTIIAIGAGNGGKRQRNSGKKRKRRLADKLWTRPYYHLHLLEKFTKKRTLRRWLLKSTKMFLIYFFKVKGKNHRFILWYISSAVFGQYCCIRFFGNVLSLFFII